MAARLLLLFVGCFSFVRGTHIVRPEDFGAVGDGDGLVLVGHEMLGITKYFSQRFLRRYADLGETVDGAVRVETAAWASAASSELKSVAQSRPDSLRCRLRSDALPFGW